ncbi:MAG: histidine kinase, partial [Acidobacteriota bacterium]
KEIAVLVNFLGFLTGAVLYAMLLAMVLRTLGGHRDHGRRTRAERPLLATALLGLSWNIGALIIYGVRDLSLGETSPWLAAVSFTALGFLPAVVVDSTVSARGVGAGRRPTWLIAIAAYLLSGVASLLHFYSALTHGVAPSAGALRALTFGFSFLIVAMIIQTRNQTGWGRAVWVVALAVFAVSALHLSQHQEGESWWIELIGHHASLPLALAILYQDYRFALADIFLKRAMVLVVLVALAFGLYVSVAAPMLSESILRREMGLRAISALIGLWVGTALLYPLLQRAVEWFVDTIVLGRADYIELRAEIGRIVASGESPEAILDGVCARLKWALTAQELRWELGGGPVSDALTAVIEIPVAEPPGYRIAIGPLAGGRRLLSDDFSMLEAVGVLTARRLDSLRVTNERFARDLRERQISQLATEAELRALRAQLNPHFLFNALTTIGHLIQTAPDRALATLLRLTELLRGVLRRPTGEFITLGDELALIDSYLAIERARFEERLQVVFDVPDALRSVRIPPLVLQPLVENAIKHGIAPCKLGGEVRITARIVDQDYLTITIVDSGAGASPGELAVGRLRGVGLSNVEQRLTGYYGPAGSFDISSKIGSGTVVQVTMPIDARAERRSGVRAAGT